MNLYLLGAEMKQQVTLDWSETDIQKSVSKFFSDLEVNIKSFSFFAVAGGSVRIPAHVGKKLKTMGVRAGIHDLIFLGKGGKAIFIELKVKPNTLTPAQENFHGIVSKLGFGSFCIFVKDGTDAINQIIKILQAHGVLSEPVCNGL
jgi:hypothetical protein